MHNTIGNHTADGPNSISNNLYGLWNEDNNDEIKVTIHTDSYPNRYHAANCCKLQFGQFVTVIMNILRYTDINASIMPVNLILLHVMHDISML